MNPVGSTIGKSCGNNLRPSENRQGLLADLRPSSPDSPRMAAVAHQPRQGSESRFLAMHPATPGGNGASNGQASPRQGDPSHDLSREHRVPTLNTDVYARFGCIPASPFHLRKIDAAIPATGLLAQGHPPVGESRGPALPTGQISAPLFGGDLEVPSGRAAMASGDERADLLDSMVNRLLSDEYEAYDPEDPNVRALMADYEATILTTGASSPTSAVQGHPPAGESLGPAWPAGQIHAPLFDGDLEVPSGRAAMASSGERADLLDSVVNHLLSDEYEAYDPEDPNVRALMADYEATFQDTGASSCCGTLESPSGQAIMAFGGESAKRPAGLSADPDLACKKKHAHSDDLPVASEQRQAISHIFETDPERSNRSIADEIGVTIKKIRTIRRQYDKTGHLKPGNTANRLTDEQRRTLVHIFETDPKRSNQSIVDEIGVSFSTIYLLRKMFSKTGNLQPGDSKNRLAADQRRAILHILKTDPERESQSIADEFGVTTKTIRTMRRQFGKTGNLNPGNTANRLTDEQRRTLVHIFETDPKRSSQSIADEISVGIRTIQVTRRQFRKTGNLQPGDHTNRLTTARRQALLHIFETDPKRSNQSLVDEFGVAYSTIHLLRRQFRNTGNLQPGDHTNRLTAAQRQALLHIFETDPERSGRSLVDEFGIAASTIQALRGRFRKSGNLQPGDHTNRLTAAQRQALLHIFETDPKRKNQNIADEFGVNVSTMRRLRERFRKTGNLQPGDHTKRLTSEQRRALFHIFETDPKRNNQNIANEFGVNVSTIRRLKERFRKTDNIEANRMTID